MSRIVSKPSKAFSANYDAIDWSIGPSSEEIEARLEEVRRKNKENRPVKGIPCIREDKPHVSVSGAIHVDQVKEFNKECVKGTHYDPKNGNLISTSTAAREREARRRGKSFN